MRVFPRSERAQNLVLFALVLPVILASLGLVIDVGYSYLLQRAAQNAADQGAQAAAMTLMKGGTTCANPTARSAATTSATHLATANTFTKAGAASINVECPPTSGSHSGDNSYVRVTVTQAYTPIFARLVWNGTLTTVTQATGGVQLGGLAYMAIVLDETNCRTFKMTGSGSVSAATGIQVNSGCTDAMYLSGSGSITTASPITIHGSYSKPGSGSISPSPATGQPVQPDPLAGLAVPDPSGMTVRGSGTPASPHTYSITGSGSATLSPGVYYGGIDISGSGAVTFQPGSYYLAGTGLVASGSGAITGNNVFFYITQDTAKPTVDGKMGVFKLSGSGSVALTPPGSGPYMGILIFVDRSQSAAAAVDLSGSGALAGSKGVVYTKTGGMVASGSGGSAYQNWVVDTLNLSGSGSMALMGYSGPVAGLVSKAFLAE